MRRGLTVQGGIRLAAIAVVLVAAGCVPNPPPAPPAAPASLAVSPSPVTFPSTPPPYSWMPTVQVTVKNTGGRALSSLVVNGVGVYSVPNLNESNNCFDAPTNAALGAGKSCVVDIQFCPTAPGLYQNQLVVTGQDATSGTPLQATTMLNGTAT